MKIKNQIHLIQVSNSVNMDVVYSKVKAVDTFLDRNLNFNSIKPYMIATEELSNFNSVNISIIIVTSQITDIDIQKNTYKQILKYNIMVNLNESTQRSLNNGFKKIKETFYRKLIEKNIQIKDLNGVFIQLQFEE